MTAKGAKNTERARITPRWESINFIFVNIINSGMITAVYGNIWTKAKRKFTELLMANLNLVKTNGAGKEMINVKRRVPKAMIKLFLMYGSNVKKVSL